MIDGENFQCETCLGSHGSLQLDGQTNVLSVSVGRKRRIIYKLLQIFTNELGDGEAICYEIAEMGEAKMS
jgi:hypothetical protein